MGTLVARERKSLNSMPLTIRRLDLTRLPSTFTAFTGKNKTVTLPDFPVLYVIFNSDEVFYVGATKSLFNRFSGLKSDHKINHVLVKRDTKIAWIAVKFEQLCSFELALIQFLKPKLNSIRSGKTYHYNGVGNGRGRYLRLS